MLLGPYQHWECPMGSDWEKVLHFLGHHGSSWHIIVKLQNRCFLDISWLSVPQRVGVQGSLLRPGLPTPRSVLHRCTTEPVLWTLATFSQGHCAQWYTLCCVQKGRLRGRGAETQPASWSPGPVPWYGADPFYSGHKHHLFISCVPFGLYLLRGGTFFTWHKGFMYRLTA